MIKTTSMLTAEPKRYGFSKSKLTRMAERVECFRITRELSETDRNTPAHLSAGSIYAPPCILFEYALEHYKLISETVYTVTSATFEKKKKKKYETVFGTFYLSECTLRSVSVGNPTYSGRQQDLRVQRSEA